MERDNNQLQRDIGNLEKVLIARISSIETSISVAHEDLVRVPTQVDKAIGGLRDLIWSKLENVAERFNTFGEKVAGVEIRSQERHEARDQEFTSFKQAIESRFAERDARRNVEVSAAKEAVKAAFDTSEKAVGAAFSAAKESAAKTETSMGKQIDNLIALMTTNNASIIGKIDELKDRLGRGEGVAARTEGSTIGRERGRSDVAGWIVGAIGVIGTLVMVAYYIGHMAR